MGLIKAGMGAVGGTLADQWKEFFTVNLCQRRYLLLKGRNVLRDVLQTQKGMTILFQTVQVLP